MIVEGLVYSIDRGTDLAFVWKHERKPRKSSVSIVGVWIEFYMHASRMQGGSLALDVA